MGFDPRVCFQNQHATLTALSQAKCYVPIQKSEWACVWAWLWVCMCVCVGGGQNGIWRGCCLGATETYPSGVMRFYVQFITSWCSLNTPLVLCFKHSKIPGPLIFPISYPSLIRSEVYDFGPKGFAKFPGQSKDTLCSFEKVIGLQTEQNASHWVGFPMGIIRPIHCSIQLIPASKFT